MCRAADQGLSQAQGRLADIYYNGWFGINTDFVRSYLWFALAARSQDKWGAWAERQRKSRFNELTVAGVRQAEKMLADWQPGQCERELTPDYPGN